MDLFDNQDSYINILGAIINTTIKDYRLFKYKKNRGNKEYFLYKTAEYYLFNPNGLESLLKRIELSINIDYIRKSALNNNFKIQFFLGLENK